MWELLVLINSCGHEEVWLVAREILGTEGEKVQTAGEHTHSESTEASNKSGPYLLSETVKVSGQRPFQIAGPSA